MKSLQNVLKHLRATVLGQSCAACKAPSTDDGVCALCTLTIDTVRRSQTRCDCCATVFGAWRAQENRASEHRPLLCGACITKPPAFDAAYTLGAFNEPLSGLILQLKFGYRLSLAPWLARQLDVLVSQQRFDCIVPIPLHDTRLRERGFNQAWEIVKRMQHSATKAHALLRLRDTPSQRSISAAQRFSNVRGAFAVDETAHAVQGQHVLLVDDVVTTTATVQAASKALKQAGAARVTVLCIARVSD